MLSLRLARCTGTTTSVSLSGELPTPRTADAQRLVRRMVRLLGAKENLWIQKRAGESPEQKRKASALVKRLKRIREEVGSL